jgi:hypothetical protein
MTDMFHWTGIGPKRSSGSRGTRADRGSAHWRPFDLPTNFFEKPDELFVARYCKHKEPRISKNRSKYAPFDAAPDSYRAFIDFW